MSMTNGAVIEAEIAWFTRLVDLRFRIHGGEHEDADVLALKPPPPLDDLAVPYAAAVEAARLNPSERLVLILAALPHLRPQALDPFLINNNASARRFTEFGGAAAGPHSGFRPTRETVLFLLAGEAMDRRLAALPLFAPHAPLQHLRILDEPNEPGEPGPWLPLLLSQSWLSRLTTGAKTPPRFGADFPAQPLVTPYEWTDLVLPAEVREELEDIAAWFAHEELLMKEWGLSRHLKPGYRALFHGPPGTGKTVTAAVLGKRLDRPVYRVDLSRVVSKWIGETEKNLGTLFDHADGGDMILFFDEADALFGKRADTRSANDRHANQQIAYLLQRIEDCPGVVILASNLKRNIDPAFARRFQTFVHFSMPDAEARLKLWEAAFAKVPNSAAAPLDFGPTAREAELAGGSVINVLRSACLRAAHGGSTVTMEHIRTAIGRERAKDGELKT
jgi:ATPase family associated with various cellular activities (AAA)